MKEEWIRCPDCGKKLCRIEGKKLYIWCKGEKKEVEIDIGEKREENAGR